MRPHNYRVYIGPYVDGPAAPARTPGQQPRQGRRTVSEPLRQLLLDLLPSPQRRQSRTMFCLEMLAVAALLASVIVNVSGGGALAGVLLGLVALLAAGAFGCGLASVVRRRRDAQRVAGAVNVAEPLAYRLIDYQAAGPAGPLDNNRHPLNIGPDLGRCWRLEALPPEGLQTGDVILVESGQVIPADGTVLEGAARVDESVVTGESAPVLRERGCVEIVMRGTTILEGRIIVEVSAKRGHPLDWSSTPPQTSLQPR